MTLPRLAAAMALAAAFLCAGCATEHYEMDAKHPAAVMLSDGSVQFRGRFYTAEQFPRALKKAGIPCDRMINVRVPDTMSSLGALRLVRARLGQAGYRRVIFNSEQRSISTQADGVDPIKDPRIYHEPGRTVYGAGW